MPNELRERIAADVTAAIADPVILSLLAATGQVAMPGRAAEFKASIDKQRAAVAQIAKMLGIKGAQ